MKSTNSVPILMVALTRAIFRSDSMLSDVCMHCIPACNGSIPLLVHIFFFNGPLSSDAIQTELKAAAAAKCKKPATDEVCHRKLKAGLESITLSRCRFLQPSRLPKKYAPDLKTGVKIALGIFGHNVMPQNVCGTYDFRSRVATPEIQPKFCKPFMWPSDLNA